MFGRGQRGWGVKLTIYLNRVATLRMSRTVSAPPIRLHGANTDKFTIVIIIIIIIIVRNSAAVERLATDWTVR
jgi:hypothetical protein